MFIVKEGVPYSDLTHMSIQEDSANNCMTLNFSVALPLEKLKDIRVPNGNIYGFLSDFVHPELNGGRYVSPGSHAIPIAGNYVHYNSSGSYYMKDDALTFSMAISLNMSSIGETRRRIEDSTFHSLLEAALEN